MTTPINVDEARKALAWVGTFTPSHELPILSAALARLEELEKLAAGDPTTATRGDLRRWTADQHDEIRNIRAERDALLAKLGAIHLELSLRTGCATTGDNALAMVEVLAQERDDWKLRYDTRSDGLFEKLVKERGERDQLRADALAHLELHGQLRARVTELEALREAEERDRQRSDTTVGAELGNLYGKVDALRAQLETAEAKYQAVYNDPSNGWRAQCEAAELAADKAELECERLRGQLAELESSLTCAERSKK